MYGGKAILYGDKMTDSTIAAIDETDDRRRGIQSAHNKLNNITPQSIVKTGGNRKCCIIADKYFGMNDEYKIRFNCENCY
jgi:excinuclease UvrABC helicase subunit UvrB